MGNIFLQKQHFDTGGVLQHLGNHTLWVLADEGGFLGYYRKFRVVPFTDKISWFQCFSEFLAQGSNVCILTPEEMPFVPNQVVAPNGVSHETVEAVNHLLKESISPRFAKELLSEGVGDLYHGWVDNDLPIHFEELYDTTSDVNPDGEYSNGDWPHGCEMEKVYKVYTSEGWRYYAVHVLNDSFSESYTKISEVCEVDVSKGKPALRFLKA